MGYLLIIIYSTPDTAVFLYALFNSFNTHSLHTFCMPGTVLSEECSIENKTDEASPPSWSLHFSKEDLI